LQETLFTQRKGKGPGLGTRSNRKKIDTPKCGTAPQGMNVRMIVNPQGKHKVGTKGGSRQRKRGRVLGNARVGSTGLQLGSSINNFQEVGKINQEKMELQFKGVKRGRGGGRFKYAENQKPPATKTLRNHQYPASLPQERKTPIATRVDPPLGVF